MKKGLCVVITGASGAGKSAVIKRLLEEISDSARLVTTTSREPRKGEMDGVDYNFVSRDHFIHMTERGELLEWEETYGNLYGSERARLKKMLGEHEVVFVALDIRGAKTYQKVFPGAATLALFVPPEQIPGRILGRALIDSIELEKRIEAVADEQNEIGIFDYIVENLDGQLETETIPHAKQFVLNALAKNGGEKSDDAANEAGE